MAMNERVPKTSRTLGEQILLLGLSLVPIIVAGLMIRVKSIRNLLAYWLAYPLYLLMMTGGYCVGSRWHRLVRLDNDISDNNSSLDHADNPLPNKPFDWLPMAPAYLYSFA